ncbi:hypothetical protein BG015_000895 [Linnemannia schmuckeri]|uniref:Uncharacterized protein n=1 Tax=Linnemannia schmuckeri TaxID=64567 RepID=A0A9P5V7B5_9FUNG|nr:hypothetical protein BG015_000895 [Linnemannia schmuckeri]
MPTTRTFSFVFRGKQVEVEREYASDEEELINTKPRCLWPDDGRDYSPQEQEQQDDYYEEDNQLVQYEQHDDESRVEPAVQYHHHEHNNHVGYEQQDSPGTPPPTSPILSSPGSQAAEHSGHDHDRHDEHDAYEEEEDDFLPPQPIISRGYVAESVTMIQHHSQLTGAKQEGDYTDEEDNDHNVEQDDTMYTALYGSSDNEDASPMYGQESSLNPFEHIPNPQEDWLIAQERERQRVASRHKLGIVGRGIKYPIPADLLEAPSPTTTFGRTTLWPIRVEAPDSSTSRQRTQNLRIPTQPNFSTGPAFNLASTSTSMSASAAAAASLPLTTTSAPSAQAQSQSARVTVPEDKKKGRVSTSTSTVVTRPAQPNEIQAIYAAILGRRNVPEKEQEERSRSKHEGIGARHNNTIATGGSGSSLYGSEEEQELEEKLDVLEEYDGEEVTLTAEELFQEKVAELGPCNPASKRHVTTVDECEVEDEADEDDTLHASEQGDVTGLHKCEVFDGLCWDESKRELTVGVYWFHKGERGLRCVHRRFDKFQLMGDPDTDESSRDLLRLSTSQNSTSEPTTPQLSLDTGSLSSGYFSS